MSAKDTCNFSSLTFIVVTPTCSTQKDSINKMILNPLGHDFFNRLHLSPVIGFLHTVSSFSQTAVVVASPKFIARGQWSAMTLGKGTWNTPLLQLSWIWNNEIRDTLLMILPVTPTHSGKELLELSAVGNAHIQRPPSIDALGLFISLSQPGDVTERPHY